MAPVKSRREEYAESTKVALMESARDLFAERGYADTSIAEVVDRARLTRGALYHHFESKQDLFEAVLEQAESDLVAQIAANTSGATAWERALAGLEAFLEAASDPISGQIALREGPAVLGWRRWREFDKRHTVGLLRIVLQDLIAEHCIPALPLDMLVAIFYASLGEASLSVGQAKNPEAARAEAAQVMRCLLEGLSMQAGAA